MKVYKIPIFNSSKRIKDVYTLHTAISLAIYQLLFPVWIIRLKVILKFKNLWI